MLVMEKRIGKVRQLSYQSHPEIVGVVDRIATRFAERRSYLGKKIGPGPVANAMVLWFGRLSEDVQDQIIDESLTALEDFEMGRESVAQEVQPSKGLPAANNSSRRKDLPKSK